MFITNREIDLINNITNEVIKDICGQTIIYYAINEEYTKTNFYSESDQKVFDTPLEIPAEVDSLISVTLTFSVADTFFYEDFAPQNTTDFPGFFPDVGGEAASEGAAWAPLLPTMSLVAE